MTAGRRLGSATLEDSPLPQLQDALLDSETLEQLLRDIQRCAVVQEVLLKGGAVERVSGTPVSLAEAMEALRQERVLGVQIRYWFDGSNWWDTLMRTPNGIRLIRIEHRLAG
ncbi:hypothetical protein F0U60_16320 [Archangium minus]|uniref:Uncharacterized protein n=1 Tax=Archangium minus TaxID=83450 RepID=A0ABY9WP34_9BACT|nr:hypothetical protein F0U61_16165 [Archangium violaceum]WNG45488.1 hypothetical protein F0U60_16320 [Archangium minus]